MALGIARKPIKPLKAPLPRQAPRPLQELPEADERYLPAAAAVARWWTELLLSHNEHEDERYKETFGRAFNEALRDITAREMSLCSGSCVVMTAGFPGFALTEAIRRAGGGGMFAPKLPPFTITIAHEDGVIKQNEDGSMTPIWGNLASEVRHV